MKTLEDSNKIQYISKRRKLFFYKKKFKLLLLELKNELVLKSI